MLKGLARLFFDGPIAVIRFNGSLFYISASKNFTGPDLSV
jgi:hypothetical protein